jgi:xanthine/uracil/vitamin C permease (AzgA family)
MGAKSILAGVGTFIAVTIFLYVGVMTRWTFVPRENVATGVGLLRAYAPYVFGVGLICAIVSALVVQRFSGNH